MKRLGAILVPMLAGFLVTVAIVSWRAGWWQQRDARDPAATAPPSVEVRRPNLRIVPVHLTTAPPAAVAAIPAAAAPVRAAALEPEAAPVSDSYEPPPAPRANAGNSPDLEVPVRKFARGGRADPE